MCSASHNRKCCCGLWSLGGGVKTFTIMRSVLNYHRGEFETCSYSGCIHIALFSAPQLGAHWHQGITHSARGICPSTSGVSTLWLSQPHGLICIRNSLPLRGLTSRVHFNDAVREQWRSPSVPFSSLDAFSTDSRRWYEKQGPFLLPHAPWAEILYLKCFTLIPPENFCVLYSFHLELSRATHTPRKCTRGDHNKTTAQRFFDDDFV